jgi:hypothetical protein
MLIEFYFMYQIFREYSFWGIWQSCTSASDKLGVIVDRYELKYKILWTICIVNWWYQLSRRPHTTYGDETFGQTGEDEIVIMHVLWSSCKECLYMLLQKISTLRYIGVPSYRLLINYYSTLYTEFFWVCLFYLKYQHASALLSLLMDKKD